MWTHIDRAFSQPTTSRDDTADYVPTQMLAELFKTEGFDGISYKSAFGDDGYNIALFNLDDAELTSCRLHDVTSVEFSFEQSGSPYWVTDGGARGTVSVDVTGSTAPPEDPDH